MMTSESSFIDRTVMLDVGGRHFKTTVYTLTRVRGTFFDRMFSGACSPCKDNDTVFIDRDGDLFAHILSFLRNGAKTELPKERCQLLDLKREAEHYAILDLVNLLEERLYDPGRVMALNVGGTIHYVTATTLRNAPVNSPLWKIGSDDGPISEDEQGRIFIDRDGGTFQFVLDFLRTGAIVDRRGELSDRSTWQRLELEANFYRLTSMVDALLDTVYPMRQSYQASKTQRLVRQQHKRQAAALVVQQRSQRRDERRQTAAAQSEDESPKFSAHGCPTVSFM